MRIGLGFLGGPDLRHLAEIGRSAEEAGFESLWHAETRVTRDSVTAMTALLMATERVRVGSAAINAPMNGPERSTTSEMKTTTAAVIAILKTSSSQKFTAGSALSPPAGRSGWSDRPRNNAR